MDELPQDQLNLLETIYDVLRTQDRWPPYRFLEDYLDAKYRIDIEKLAGTLPRNLTTLPLPWHPKNDQQEIQLTIEGLRFVELPGADDDVGLFFRIFRRFVEELNRLVPTIDAQPNPCLTTDGLTIERSVHPTPLRRVFRIALLEPWSAGGGAIGPDALNFQVCAYPRALRPYRGPKRSMIIWNYGAESTQWNFLRSRPESPSNTRSSDWAGQHRRLRRSRLGRLLLLSPNRGTVSSPMLVPTRNHSFAGWRMR